MKQTDKEKLQATFQQLLTEPGTAPSHSARSVERILDASEHYLPAYEPNVDAGLARLRQRIATSENNPTARVVPMRSRRRWLNIAAAVALLIGALAAFQLYFNRTATDYNTLITAADELQVIELADGSTVRLNEHSSLSYPTTFSGATRRVQLTGEAFFDVTKAAQPFVIETAATTVRVLGTTFNVRANPMETVTKVLVQTGTVEVIDSQTDRKVVLAPYEAAIHQHGATIEKVTDNDLQDLAWHTLDFKKVAVGEIIAAMENHYQVAIDTDEAEVLNCLQTINFAEADLNTTFAILQTSLNVAISQTAERQFTIRGGSCAAVQ